MGGKREGYRLLLSRLQMNAVKATQNFIIRSHAAEIIADVELNNFVSRSFPRILNGAGEDHILKRTDRRLGNFQIGIIESGIT